MHYKNVLLIDDDEDDHEIFLSAIEEINKEVTCVGIADAAKALEQLEAKHLNPEIIFLDLNMPVMSGQEFLIEIKKKSALNHIPVIMFSTSASLPTIMLTRELGAVDFITKPQNYDQLVELLTPYVSIEIK